MTWSVISMIETESPDSRRFSAISNPINPPPTTAALRMPSSLIIARILSVSGTVQSVWIRGESMPGIGGRKGDEPVEMTRVS